ncbi:MAG: AfsR/SARP family transcriptional regulator [Gemmatirosa sp.]
MMQLRVLGAADLRDRDGRELTSVLAQPRRLALLAFLALAPPGEYQRRATLLGVFWPEADEEHARGALRQALCFLRREMGASAFPSRGGNEVRFAADACWCDAVAFEASLAAGACGVAAQLYRGDLLTGLYIDAAPAFDEWLEQRRARLARAYETALEQIATSCAARCDHVGAVDCWRTLTERAPVSGHAVLGLMLALDAAGDRAGALRACALHRVRLARELDARPDASILALEAHIRDQT